MHLLTQKCVNIIGTKNHEIFAGISYIAPVIKMLLENKCNPLPNSVFAGASYSSLTIVLLRKEDSQLVWKMCKMLGADLQAGLTVPAGCSSGTYKTALPSSTVSFKVSHIVSRQIVLICSISRHNIYIYLVELLNTMLK